MLFTVQFNEGKKVILTTRWDCVASLICNELVRIVERKNGEATSKLRSYNLQNASILMQNGDRDEQVGVPGNYKRKLWSIKDEK